MHTYIWISSGLQTSILGVSWDARRDAVYFLRARGANFLFTKFYNYPLEDLLSHIPLQDPLLPYR